MIDLSFLTDEEQEAILKVLQRDANLKRAEEERVRHLPEKVNDENQIKNMSGQWFYEVKSKRHRDKIHGADIIRASMRRKPLTAAELSQNKNGKKQKSWVNNVNKEVFTPPELFGAIEEAEGESKSSLSPTAFNADATPQEGTKKAAASPSKERKNPFNNSNLLEDNADRKHSERGISSSSETSKKDSLLPSVENQPEVNVANGRLEKPELASVEPNDPTSQTGKPPVPKARRNVHKTSDVSVTSEDSFSKAPRRIQPGNGQGTPPRGILKRNSSTSSTDSEILRLNQAGDPSYKNGLPASTILEGVVDKNSYPGRDPEGFSQNSLERAKQVRFSSSVSRKERPPSLELHEGKESGEFGLLDSDCGKTGGDQAHGSDSLRDKQTPLINLFASTSMDLNGCAEDQAVSKEGKADLVSYNANGSGQPSGTVQSQESSPAEHGASSDSSRETFPKVTKEPSSDETKLEIKTGQRSPGPDDKPSSAGQPLPLANTEDPQAPSVVPTDLEQGKPVFVGDPSAKTPSKSDKHAAEASKAADESISKVLDWFKRSSSTESEGTTPSSASQGREPSEEMSVTETRKLAITKEENASSRDVVNLDPSLCDSKVLTGKDLRFHDGGSQPELLSFAQIRSPSRPLLEEQRFSCDGKERDIAEPRDQRSAHFQTTGQETNYAGEANLLEEAGGGSEAEGETAACREPKFSDGVKLGLSANSSGKEREVENRTQADGERSVSSYMKEGSFENQARVLPKEPEGQESGLKGIVQRDASADRRNLLWTQQQEIKQASPTEDQKRIKDIRAFWEREPTSPRFGSQEDLLSQNTSINKRTHGDKSESRKAKPAGESSGYVRGESDSEESKYNWVTFRRVELSDDSEPNDNNMNVSLRRIKPELTDKSQGGSAVTRSSKTLPSNWKGAGFTESPEAGNLQTGNDATFSPKRGGDVHTVALAKDKKSSTLPQKPNFTVHSLKEKVNEESKSEMLNPSQFQSLRSFWGAGVKPQGRINEAKETRIPQGNSMGTYQQPSMEIKGVRVEVGQTSLEEEQKSETNQGFLKATPNQPLLANEVSRKSLRFVRQENSYLVESAVSKPMEKMAPPGKEVEESVEKTVVPSKMQPILFNSDLQKLLMQTSQESLPVDLLSDERAAPKETEGQTHYTDHAIQHRTVSTDIGSNVGLPTSEIAETVHRTVIPPKVDVDSFNAGIERLFREALDARPSSEGSEAVNTSKQSSPSEERSFYNKVMQLSHNACPTDQTKRDVLPQSLEKCVSTSDQNIKFKTEGDAPVETTGVNSALQTAPNHKEYQVYQDDISSQKEDLRIPSPTPILPDARLADLNRAKPPGKEVSDTVTESRVPLKRENHDLNSQLLILLEEASELPSVSCMTESISKAAAGGLPGEGQETSALPSPTTVCLSRQTSSEKTEKRDDIFGRMGEDPNGETAMVLPFVNQKNVRGQSHDRGRGDVTSVGKPAEPQLEEVGERAVKTAKPNALEPSRFKDSLNNLMKEDSQVFLKDIEFPKPVFASLRTSQSVTSVDDKGMPPSQEIHEFVEKATAPSNSMYAEFQTNFQKLLMEDMTFLPSNQERTNGNKVERTANDKSEPNQISGLVGQQEVGLQEVEETVHKRFVPSKRQQNELHSGLQKLLAEFSHMSPAQIEELGEKLKAKIQTGQGVEEAVDLSQGGVEKSVAPAEKTVFDFYSGKLTEENSDASLQLSKDRNLQAPYDSPSRSENRNTLVTMPALIRRSSSDYRSELRIPLKGKASKPDVQVPADGKISVVLAGNVFSQKIEQVSLLSTEAPLPGKEASSPTVAKAVETETGYHTQRDAAVVSSANVTLDGRTEEMDVPLGSRRTSTPRAEQETPPRLSQVELILASCHGKSEEDEGAGNFGSDLSNESINSFAEIKRNSTCSAEDPNPVLEALKRSSNRQIPSKSLEDIPSATSNEGKVNARKEDLMLSAEDVSAAPSFPVNQFSNPEKVKRMSKSVPTFLQEESDDRETDTASESSYSLGKIKKSPSSLTNLSGSSGLASLSSVSTSVMSVYSGDFGNVDVKGNIQFAIDYVEQLKELHIFIAQCKDLAVADVKKQRSDPYVKCYLLPEKYKLGKRKTSVKKKTLNPVYNEILRYKVDKILLTSQRLNISVWHNDTFGRNSFLGEVDLDLGSWDWDDRQIKQMIWYPLKPRAPLASLELENRGEIKLSLKYIPQPVGGKKPSATGEVHIWVKECNDLPLLKGNKLNSFVKCTVLPDTSRKSRQKTRAVAKATNPVFNHTMVYDGFKFEDLKEACVELTVWDHKQLVNHFLGGLRIGLGTGKSYGTAVDWMDSTLEETSLWERMMNSPDQWVEGTLPLRMLTIAKLTK